MTHHILATSWAQTADAILIGSALLLGLTFTWMVWTPLARELRKRHGRLSWDLRFRALIVSSVLGFFPLAALVVATFWDTHDGREKLLDFFEEDPYVRSGR